MKAQARVYRGLLSFVSVPVVAGLLVTNVLLWYVLHRHFQDGLRQPCSQMAQQIDYALLRESLRLETLAKDPALLSLLSARLKRVNIAKMEKIEKGWSALDENDWQVREVLNNGVAEQLRIVANSEPFILRLILTDAEGRLLAASEKTDHYSYRGAGWWSDARDRGLNKIVSEGLVNPFFLGLSFAVTIQKGEYTRIGGILRIELDIRTLFKKTAATIPEAGMVSVFSGEGANLVFGAPGPVDNIKTKRKALRKALEDQQARFGRYQLTDQLVSGEIDWLEPVFVATLHRSARFPVEIYGPVGICILLSIFVLYIMHRMIWRAIDRKFEVSTTELMEAGDWILQNALGRPSALHKRTERASERALSPVQRKLEEWVDHFRRDMERAASSRNADMTRDLDLAKDFQHALIERPYPIVPDVHFEGRLRLHFSHCYNPASALGGDFFDLLTLGRDSAGIFVADVMGHGTRSALITAILRTLIGDLIKQGRNAPHFLQEINRQFCDLMKGVPSPLFASAFYFVADTTSRVATFSSAGHPAPFHIRRGVGRISRLEVPPPRSIALGVMPEEVYTGGHIRLALGDVFIFFTDGVYEAFNGQGEEFGLDRMEETLKDLMYRSLEDLVDGLHQEVLSFIGAEPTRDDICIVAVEITDRPKDEDGQPPLKKQINS